ncbi:MAG: Lar family restriction alleviation protein [Coriobacteriia bacterium]|nr:Lar family restriction alleviation protein [Coriobacteriia bacterium]
MADGFKPCPVCGRTDEVGRMYDGSSTPAVFYTWCKRCGVGTLPVHSLEEALAAWDDITRPEPPKVMLDDGSGVKAGDYVTRSGVMSKVKEVVLVPTALLEWPEGEGHLFMGANDDLKVLPSRTLRGFIRVPGAERSSWAVIVKGMRMPVGCYECPFNAFPDHFECCALADLPDIEDISKRLPECPLEEVGDEK